MKCKKCGHRSTTISAMAKHYRQKHPSAMKRMKREITRAKKTKSYSKHPISTAYEILEKRISGLEELLRRD